MNNADKKPLLSLRNITKIYPGGVIANKDISLDIYPGEILALLGENGAGKTTLVSIAAGLIKPTRGQILVKGESVVFNSPRDAMRKGIALIPQNPMLIDNFTVLENLVLVSRLAGKRYGIRLAKKRLEEIEKKYGLFVNPSAYVWSLSFGERQKAEILKALLIDASIVLLDEPTTHLSPVEVDKLLSLTRQLANEGRGVVFITHRLSEALRVADRIAVMRRGRLVAVVSRKDARVDQLLNYMFGEERIGRLTEIVKRRRSLSRKVSKDIVLRVDDLWVRGPHGEFSVRGASLELRGAEILGVAGIAGNGQREFFETLIGIRKPSKGMISICGVDVTSQSSSMRGRLGVGIIPEDRLGWALVPGKSLVFNTVLGLYSSPKAPIRFSIVNWRIARKIARDIIKSLEVKVPGPDANAESLSGGNMQRFIVGRELYKAPCLLLAMNPTSGLDVEAAERIRDLLLREAVRGAGILLVSEDLDELVEVSDRIVVMSRGRIVYEAYRPFNIDKIAEAMTVS